MKSVDTASRIPWWLRFACIIFNNSRALPDTYIKTVRPHKSFAKLVQQFPKCTNYKLILHKIDWILLVISCENRYPLLCNASWIEVCHLTTHYYWTFQNGVQRTLALHIHLWERKCLHKPYSLGSGNEIPFTMRQPVRRNAAIKSSEYRGRVLEDAIVADTDRLFEYPHSVHRYFSLDTLYRHGLAPHLAVSLIAPGFSGAQFECFIYLCSCAWHSPNRNWKPHPHETCYIWWNKNIVSHNCILMNQNNV